MVENQTFCARFTKREHPDRSLTSKREHCIRRQSGRRIGITNIRAIFTSSWIRHRALPHYPLPVMPSTSPQESSCFDGSRIWRALRKHVYTSSSFPCDMNLTYATNSITPPASLIFRSASLLTYRARTTIGISGSLPLPRTLL